MASLLTQHAIDNVWCSSQQDKQFVFRVKRLTPPLGVRFNFDIEWTRLTLPDTISKYHVYQIGQNSTSNLNLLPDNKVWYTAEQVMNEHNLILNIYDDNFRNYPKNMVFFRLTETRNLIIAIKETPLIAGLDTSNIYLRLYSNAYFNSVRSNEALDRTYVETRVFETDADYAQFMKSVRDIRFDWKGHVYLFKNGFLVDDLKLNEMVVGDHMELIHDTTIYQVYDFKITEIDTFDSVLDNVRKYLLFRRDHQREVIDFEDDIDVWFMCNGTGIYYHRFGASALRMVTHKDYSIPTQSIANTYMKIPNCNSITEVTIRIHVRDSGYFRPLILEHNRLHELNKLDDDKVIQAMIGLNSTLPEWKATNLENSTYNKIMSSALPDINQAMVEDAYGYNAVSKLFGDTPLKPIDNAGMKAVRQPLALRHTSTATEYSVIGKLIDFYHHQQGDVYEVNNEITGYVETIFGLGGDGSGILVDIDKVEIRSYSGYRCYKTERIGSSYDINWEEAQEGIDYHIVNNQIHWLIDQTNLAGLVKFDNEFLFRTYYITPLNGTMSLDVTSNDNWNGVMKDQPLYLPPGKLEVFLNDHPILENLDYFVDWPRIVFCNKEFLTTDNEQKITIRCTGFCEPTMVRRPVDEFGFIEHGRLSSNSRFDIRDDKVMKVIVNGRLYLTNELSFSEDHYGVTLDDAVNGAPYVVDEIIVPLEGNSLKNTYDFRDISRDLDKRISDYMTLYWPAPPILEPSIIERRYAILSPFISRIHYDLTSGYLYPDFIKTRYGEHEIRSVIKVYEWLLDYDPVNKVIDDRYVVIHPHHLNTETELNVHQYTFLNRIIELYMNNRIDLTSHVRIKEGWI